MELLRDLIRINLNRDFGFNHTYQGSIYGVAERVVGGADDFGFTPRAAHGSSLASGASGVDFLVADDQRYNAEDGEDLVALVCILHFNRVYLFAKIQQVVLAS